MSDAGQARRRVALIGRPNVGKSTLFNRLLGRRRALVHDLPGVTRDRLEEDVEWWVAARRHDIRLIDTGGLLGEKFRDEIARQVELALRHADVAIWVVDGSSGRLPEDEEFARLLRSKLATRENLRVILAVNKVDDPKHEGASFDFHGLGVEELVEISAEHDRGIETLREAIVSGVAGEALPEEEETYGEEPEVVEPEYVAETPRLAIVGRPNVGKSTLINALLGEERMIASPVAGTTVDAIDSKARLGGREVILIDTAGIRRKAKTEQGVEVLAVLQAKKALARADIAILLLDGEAGTSEQDEKIGGLIEEAGCSVIIALNKWDTQVGPRGGEKPGFGRKEAAERIRGKIGFLKYAPLVFLSARDGTGLDGLGELVEDVLHQRKLKIPTSEFSKWVRKEAEVHNPQGARFFISHQASRHPPTFVCHVNDPEKIHFSLERHLINALRERWGYMGTPVRLKFVNNSRTGRSARL